ncbi:hypothetical protein OH77DRAFT_347340 [Trametes cingulata]|nr:hypothetical protein OH77DRAFT_347340 [Trametes cingulata]
MARTRLTFTLRVAARPAPDDAPCPIHRLPPELLMPILYNARYRLRDVRLAHVCRRWRELLLNMPEFWAAMLKHFESTSDELHAGRSVAVELLEQCLRLSAPLPFKLRFALVGEAERLAVAPHLSRAAELCVSVPSLDAALLLAELLFHSDLPNLTVLCYQPDSLEIPAAALPFEHFTLRALVRLDVPADCLCPCAVTGQLEHLVLRGPAENRPWVMDGLRACTGLTYLKMKDVGKHWPQLHFDGAPPPDSEMIHLPNLRQLAISDADVGILNILGRLSVPPTVHIRLSSAVWPCSHFDPQTVFAAPTVLTLDVLPAVRRLYLGKMSPKSGVRLVGYAGDGTERFNLSTLRDYEGNMFLEELLRPWTEREVTTLAINLPRLPLDFKLNSCLLAMLVDYVVPPRTLSHLELLGSTPPEARRLFVRWLLHSSGQPGAPALGAMTLCWAYGVEEGREEETRAELEALESTLRECQRAGQRLGKLHLYGTKESRVIVTSAAEVRTVHSSTMAARPPFEGRFTQLADEVCHVITLPDIPD